ncbi:hypothetical protein NXS19_011578 [Fusarium pseudograminearum]|nr:hypothetical protein NXS19_011578 [Fusarium pseudograminearum]
MVADGSGKYVVLLYTLLLGVLLPWVVGSWWYGTMRMSKEGVLMESANNLFRQYDDEIEEGGIITALSVGKEFEAVVKGDKIETALSKIESRITADSDCQPTASGMSVKDKDALQDLDNGARRKALALLWAYLGRVELDDPTLTKAKLQTGPIARALNQSFNAITLAYGNISPIANSFYTSQNLVQAVAPHASPLLQLPHITPKIASAIEGETKTHMPVHRFMDRPDAQRRQMAIGEGLLTEEQYETAIGVAKQIPFFRVCRAFFKVTGERFITPSSLVSLVIKGRFIPPGTDDVPAINELDLEDIDPAEDDIEAINGRKKKTIKGPDGKLIPIEEESILPPLSPRPLLRPRSLSSMARLPQ